MSEVSDEIPAEEIPAEPAPQPEVDAPKLTPGAALRRPCWTSFATIPRSG